MLRLFARNARPTRLLPTSSRLAAGASALDSYLLPGLTYAYLRHGQLQLRTKTKKSPHTHVKQPNITHIGAPSERLHVSNIPRWLNAAWVWHRFNMDYGPLRVHPIGSNGEEDGHFSGQVIVQFPTVAAAQRLMDDHILNPFKGRSMVTRQAGELVMRYARGPDRDVRSNADKPLTPYRRELAPHVPSSSSDDLNSTPDLTPTLDSTSETWDARGRSRFPPELELDGPPARGRPSRFSKEPAASAWKKRVNLPALSFELPGPNSERLIRDYIRQKLGIQPKKVYRLRDQETGIAFDRGRIHFRTPEEAETALKQLDGVQFGKKLPPLRVHNAPSREERRMLGEC